MEIVEYFKLYKIFDNNYAIELFLFDKAHTIFS